MSPCLADPLGFRSDGRPFWGFLGGAPDDGAGGGDSNSDKDGDDGDDSDGDDEDEKDPVKKLERSLAAARADAKKARDELRPFKTVLRSSGIHSADDLSSRLSSGSTGGSSKDGNQQDKPVDVEAIRKEAKAEARREASKGIVLAKIEARATGKFADPEDAVAALTGRWDDFLDTKGDVDARDIDHALSDLLARKPHFKVPSGDKLPGFDGGARGSAAGGKATMDSWLRDESARKRGSR